jgi:hypothetical protein
VFLCVQSLQDGSAKYDFIEVMACPGGCIGGGGQPRSQDKQILAVSGTRPLMHVWGYTSNSKLCLRQHGCRCLAWWEGAAVQSAISCSISCSAKAVAQACF